MSRAKRFTHDFAANAKAAEADPFSPSSSLLVKLGSIAVHVEEMLSPDGHAYDRIALAQLLNDAEVRPWLAAMERGAFLPVKRNNQKRGK